MEPIQNIKGVFFDLYGTLLIYGDMKAAWSNWLTAFFSRLVPLGLSLSQEDFSKECDRFFGKDPPKNGKDGFTIFENRIHGLCDRLGLVPSMDEVSVIADHIAHVWQQQVRVDPDAATVLGALKGLKVLALVSNFDHPRHVNKVISHHQLTDFFQSIVISGDVGFHKPNPRIFDMALKQTGLAPSEVVYIGDTEEDVIASRTAGMIPFLIQRPTNGTDQNTLDFNDENETGVLDSGHRFEVEVTKITSLKELLHLIQ
ncbi:MAG: HAD family hydrolase [Deltaproteobacteria bacterium]|nr:HAD family hydrolase [Deltaproteobacteria bacterium]